MEFYQFCLNFFLYGFLGWCTEVAFAAVKEKKFVNRGFLNGPICPIYGIGVGVVVQFLNPYKNNLLVLYLCSAVCVSVIEWITGFLLEKIFHNRWWDYSDMPLNLNGYICIPFSLVWGVFCVVIVDFIHPFFSDVLGMIPFTIGVVCVFLLGIAMSADLYVTAAAIFKLNRRLEQMEDIARELHKISEQIGENIYKNVSEAMERQQKSKEKAQERSQEISMDVRLRMEALKEGYDEIAAQRSKVTMRLVGAFPKMNSTKYKERLDELKERRKQLLKRK